ncbi:hypothetical protein [Modestobacter sp. NPDC049651]|uniref:hypothetical protein n=1 Tax=unclassified Modestobacter TaxID=2643866 RepID=UPI0033CE253C
MSRPLWRLAPWRRAPLLGLRAPAAVLAVLVTSAVLACAVASAPLFLSSARSAALQAQLSSQCAEAGWVQTGGWVSAPDADRAVQQAWQDEGRASDLVLSTTVLTGTEKGPEGGLGVVSAAGAEAAERLSLTYRPDALAHVRVVDQRPGDGIWVPDAFARGAGIALGDRITVGGVPVDVVGVYRDLWSTDPGAYWCDYRLLYANDVSANRAPPAWGLVTDPATFHRLAAGGDYSAVAQVEVPADTLTAARARDLVAAQDRAQARAETLVGGTRYAQTNPRLADAVDRAQLVRNGLRGPVVPVAVAGGLLALVLVASAGSFWADRRATEVRLLAARGVGPGPLAGKAALELGLPALAGAALGWAASRLLIGVLGPADDLDPSATTAAVWSAGAAFVVGLAAAAAVAGLRARGTAEKPVGAAGRWPGKVPWELALLVAAVWCWALLQSRDAVVSVGNVAQVNGLLVAFPLLAVAGAAVLLARLLTALLPRLRRWAGRRSPAVFLAVNRLAAARLAAATLLVAVTLPVAVLGYTATLTASSQRTLDAKVGVQVGAARAVTSVTRFEPPAAIDRVGTLVVRYNGSVTVPADGSPTEQDAQVLAVDPASFARTAFWDDSFADRSLADLAAALEGPAVDGRIPVVATRLPPGDPDLHVGRLAVDAQVVATARVLPGQRLDQPLVLVAADRLPEVPRTAIAGRVAEVWTDGPLGPAVDAVTAAGGRVTQVLDPALVQSTANFLGITWTFGYLSALAVFVGVIAVGGLLLYLEARSRTRVSGYVMARRLGLSRAAHLRSLVVELAGVATAGLLVGAVLAAGAVALVYRRLDVDLLRPPTELLAVPERAVLLTVAVTLLVAGLAALYAQRAADRADPATVLREDA